MIRRWAVRQQLNGEVSREEVVQAIMDGESLLWRAGGVLTILVAREPTDLPGEMLTTQVVLEWKDRTDARAQPERQGDSLPGAAPPPAPAAAPEPAAVALAEPAAGAEPDGLDPALLEDEDLTSIPPALR